jgi:hypothetical protein
LSVNGLPIEPSPGGAVVSEQTNLRYKALMNDLSAFVSARSIVASSSSIGEVMTVRQSMPAAVRLALGRPIYYRTDRGWHMTSGVPHRVTTEEPESIGHVQGATGVGLPGEWTSSIPGGGSSDSGFADGGPGSGSGGGSSGGAGSSGSGAYGDSGAGVTGGSGVLSGTSGVNNRPGGGTTGGSTGGTGGSTGGSTGGGSGGGSGSGSGSGSGGGSGDGSGGGSGDGSGGGSGGGPSPFKFLVNEEVYPQIEATFPQRNAQRAIVLNDPVFDVDNDGMFDGTANMQYYMNALVPLDYDGPLCLDWEALAFDLLVGQSDALRLRTVEQFVLAIQAAKQLRPNAQIRTPGGASSDLQLFRGNPAGRVSSPGDQAPHRDRALPRGVRLRRGALYAHRVNGIFQRLHAG